MIKIIKKENQLLLEYVPDNLRGDGVSWIDTSLKEDGDVTITRIFTFQSKDILIDPQLISDEEERRVFVLGLIEENYYKIDKDILGLQFDLLLDKAMTVNKKTFVATGNISVFNKIDKLVSEQIVIGGDYENAIPVIEFERLLKNFPTKTTLEHFAHSRISGILKDYLGTITDAEQRLNDHLNKLKPIKSTDKSADKLAALQEYEVLKYEFIRDRLNEMLGNLDAYLEKDWQKLIVEFLLLIFPKYVAVLENLHIKDYYKRLDKPTDRYIDLTLVDSNGSIDIIEIKKPTLSPLLYEYRKNYTPKKELAGTVMQVEKYLFHLNKWGVEGEKQINDKRGRELPSGMQIKVTNPKAMIILGRDNDFAADQRFDFEIIKRKYANIVDIMTYDDLLQRLENIIAKFKVKP